jgi:hypothetical protein
MVFKRNEINLFCKEKKVLANELKKYYIDFIFYKKNRVALHK